MPNLTRQLILSTCLAATLVAGTAQLPPVADTYIAENAPDDNHGALADVATGSMNSGTRARALLRFDVAGALPAGAVITSVSLQFEVTRLTMGAANSTFEVRRVHLPWTERDTDNEGTTWRRRFGADIGWIDPGGRLGIETAASPSGTVAVTGTNVYTMASTAAMVADVQYWLDTPSENHGWMLRTQSEPVNATARRIATREDTARAPRLVIEYDEPADPFRITSFSLDEQGLSLTWSGTLPDYQLQWQSEPGAPWENLGALTGEESMTVPLSGDRGLVRVAQSDTALYEMTFDATWGDDTHPTNYPSNAHWSGFVGGIHNDQVHFFRVGETASVGVQFLAERGNGIPMGDEVQEAINAGTASQALFGDSLSTGVGQVQFTLAGMVSQDYPLITLITMVAPSPDWFAGAESLNMLRNGRWVDRVTVALLPWDAGTDSGISYASPDEVTDPRGVVTLLDPYPTRVEGLLIPFGTMTFERVE